MTPRERQLRAERAKQRAPLYERIAFGVVFFVVTLLLASVGGFGGIIVSIGFFATLLIIGLIAGLMFPARKKDPPI